MTPPGGGVEGAVVTLALTGADDRAGAPVGSGVTGDRGEAVGGGDAVGSVGDWGAAVGAWDPVGTRSSDEAL